MTAKEWLQKHEKIVLSAFEVDELIGDLATMEKLAIGGEGSTHFYYRDAWEADKALIARLVAGLEAITGTAEDAYHEMWGHGWYIETRLGTESAAARAILDSVKEV